MLPPGQPYVHQLLMVAGELLTHYNIIYAGKEMCPRSICTYKLVKANTPWVACSSCDQWYHCRCVHLTKKRQKHSQCGTVNIASSWLTPCSSLLIYYSTSCLCFNTPSFHSSFLSFFTSLRGCILTSHNKLTID